MEDLFRFLVCQMADILKYLVSFGFGRHFGKIIISGFAQALIDFLHPILEHCRLELWSVL